MNFHQRTQLLAKIQQLTGSQSDILHDLVKLNLIQLNELEKLINQLTVDRFLKGQQYIKFARKLDSNDIDEQIHIISRCYFCFDFYLELKSKRRIRNVSFSACGCFSYKAN